MIRPIAILCTYTLAALLAFGAVWFYLYQRDYNDPGACLETVQSAECMARMAR